MKKDKYCFWKLVKSDALKYNDNLNIISVFVLLFLQPGFQLSLSIRLQQLVQRVPIIGKMLQKLIWYITCVVTSCYCSSYASYGSGLYFPHPCGIVIGDNVIIGENVTIYQGVTIGTKSYDVREYPIISNNVVIYAGAKIFGSICIGRSSIIGANAVVFKNIPDDSLAMGVPAKIVNKQTST